jgi:cytoskeletal protein RodZ
MVYSIGKKLQQARLAKQLSLEEAARVTRIRPDKLIDLEEDNYSSFPSMSYAKGFLQIYGRFLGVDVREFTDHIQTPNPVSSDDYDYLNAAAVGPQPVPAHRPYHFSARRQHTLLPVIVFAILIGAVVLGIKLIVNFERVGTGNLDDLAQKKEISSPSPASDAISTLPSAATPAPELAAVATPAPAPASSPALDPSREVRRAEPVAASPPTDHLAASASPLPAVATGPLVAASPAATTPAPVAPVSLVQTAEPIKQVSIRPLWKTRVTIREDAADSPPVFEDWLYPTDPPLKLKGRKFWIQVTDPGSVVVTQDGRSVPSGDSAIQIE